MNLFFEIFIILLGGYGIYRELITKILICRIQDNKKMIKMKTGNKHIKMFQISVI